MRERSDELTNNVKRKKVKGKKTGKPFWIPLIVSLVILSISCMLFTYNFIIADFNNEQQKNIVIEENERELFVIEQGDSTTSIAQRLKDGGFINNINIFKILSKFEGYDSEYKTGSHYIKKNLEPRDIMKILASPTETISITFPEGFTISEMADRIYQKYTEEYKKYSWTYDICTPEKFIAAVNNFHKYEYTIKRADGKEEKVLATSHTELDLANGESIVRIGNYDIGNAEDKAKAIEEAENFYVKFPILEGLNFTGRDNTLEGYLFPDTYLFDLSAKPEEIIGVMVDNFSDKYLLRYTTKAEELGFTSMDQVIILASIVEKEAKLGSESRRIAGVFYNRLRSSDESLTYMQSCATLQYIIKRQTGAVKEKLLLSDTKIENQYNTYLHKGMPPGPICNPGEKSIKAVLNLEKHDYYFFVQNSLDERGSHLFAKTNAEHEANKKLVNSEV